MRLNRLAILQSLFVSGLVVANIIAVKVVVIWNLVVPAAIIIYLCTLERNQDGPVGYAEKSAGQHWQA